MTRKELLKDAKPILFNTDMVRALLREPNPKTATRRVVKGFIPEDARFLCTIYTPEGYISCKGKFANGYEEKFFKLPCQPGDILYVRETWQHLYELDGNDQIIEDTGKYYYAASDMLPFDTYVDSMGVTHENIPWRPSIHMPKEAARIFLQVTDVRVERLQDITEEQTEAEGFQFVPPCLHQVGYESYCDLDGPCTSSVKYCDMSAGELFGRVLWNSTIKKSDLDLYGWDANPYVFVIEFIKIDKPEEI